MKFFAACATIATAVNAADDVVTGFPPYAYSVWVNPSGIIPTGATTNLTRCINVFSDDATKQKEITDINENVNEKIWMKFPADTQQRCETASLIKAGSGVPSGILDMQLEMFVDVIPCSAASSDCKIGTRIQYLSHKPSQTDIVTM